MSDTASRSPKRIQQIIGLVVLFVVIGGIVAFRYLDSRPDDIVITGAIGGEKSGLLSDPEVIEILSDRHGITLDTHKEGSLDMVQSSTEGMDFLWPSSEVALALYEDTNGAADDENIFNSPIVLYSWTEVTDALISEGLVVESNGIYELDTEALADVLVADVAPTWSEWGVAGVSGNVDVVTTNPARSNSGNMFSGMLSVAVNDGTVPTTGDLNTVGADVVEYYDSLGYLDNSSGDLFESFLQLGVGSNQVIAGYENQLIEFGTVNPQFQETLTTDIQIIYPNPTVYSSHPIIPLTEGGERLIAAFQDPELLEIAWTRHGFRSGQIASANDPADLDFGTVPADIRQVWPMPGPDYMRELIAQIEN